MTLFAPATRRLESALQVDLWLSQLGLAALKSRKSESLDDTDREAARRLSEYLRKRLSERTRASAASTNEILEAMAVVRVIDLDPGEEEAEAVRILLPLLDELSHSTMLPAQHASKLVELMDLFASPGEGPPGSPTTTDER